METEAEYNGSSQQPDLDDVLEKINEIAKASATGDYIYRGEPECYEKVSSSLYRECPHTEGVNFDIEFLQKDILEEAKAYIGQTDDIGLLTELQHFGGKTNLIDFTEDYLIALFFACDGSDKKDGRVILLKRKSGNYEVRNPERTINRVESQKSIFVESPTGFVTPDLEVTIPASIKFVILDYLKKHHRISIAAIYNDLHGFIRRSAHTEFLKGLRCRQEVSKTKNRKKKLDLHKKTITHYTEAIKLKSNYYAAYYMRGVTYCDIDDFDAAIQDLNKIIDSVPVAAHIYDDRGIVYRRKGEYDRAIQDLNKAIDLNPGNARVYNNRGWVWLHLKEWEKAKADLTTAKDMGVDIIKSFQNAYESVEDFEAKNKMKIPEDIAALISESNTEIQ